MLDRLAAVRVLVVGDLMLDRYVLGSVDRISPEAPVPVVRVSDEHTALGGSGNVAANVRALGGQCAVVGVVGDDAEGRLLTDRLATLGVDTVGIAVEPERRTTSKTRVMAGPQQIVRVDREDVADVSDELARRIADALAPRAEGCDVVIIEDYDKGLMVAPVVDAALEAGRDRGIPVVVDPKRRNFFAYAGATVFKPNAKEMADAFGEAIRPDDPSWMAEARTRLGCEHLLLTLGSRGIVLQSGSGRTAAPAAARAVFDVSGAGDTVSAVVALAFAAGARPAEAALLANHAAAVEVAKRGVSTVSPPEILAQIRSSG